jgi:SAM-dependent methyltransferase
MSEARDARELEPRARSVIGGFSDPVRYLRERRGPLLVGWLRRWKERKVLAECLRFAPEIESVCDCPSGPGRLFRFWRDRGLAIVGVDASPQMVDAARAELRRLGLDAEQARQGNALDLGRIVATRPQLVASVRFLYYFGRQERRALIEAFKAASSRYLLLQLRTRDTWKGRRSSRQHPERAYHTRAEVFAELEGAGLRVLAVRGLGWFSDRCFVMSEVLQTSGGECVEVASAGAH